MELRSRDFCRELLKKLMILPLQLQYIFSLLPFLVKYKLNSEIDSVNTRQNSNLYQLVPNKTTYQKWPYYFGIKIFNNLPSDLKKNCLTIRSFHWHVQNLTIPCHSQELLPFLSVMYFFLPPLSTNYSSIFSHLILPSISWSTPQSCCSQIHIVSQC
jgi:hypothetical protein